MSGLQIRNFATHIEPINNISGQDRVNSDRDNDIIIIEVDNKFLASVNDRNLDLRLSSESDVKHIKQLDSTYIKEEKEISAIDKYNEDGETEAIAMRKMGLPTGFAAPRSEITPDTYKQDDVHTFKETNKKGVNKVFFCQVCEIELNSQYTMESHVNGSKHRQNDSLIPKKITEAKQSGELSIALPLGIIEIDNPQPKKKKLPIRLNEKINETMEPVVGLKYIVEYVATSDIEMEPSYECKLCGNQGQANCMFSHIMGCKHRQKFVDKIYGENPHYISLSQKELLTIANKYKENEQNLSDLIRTVENDEEYPWPAGKEPWSVEMGGSGIAPDKARVNWGKMKYKQETTGDKVDNNTLDQGPSISFEHPLPNSLTAPKNSEEALRYLELGAEMLKHVIEYKNLFSKEKEKVYQSNLASLVNMNWIGLQNVDSERSMPVKFKKELI